MRLASSSTSTTRAHAPGLSVSRGLPVARGADAGAAAEAVATLMHDSTRAQEDPSEAHEVLKVPVQLGPGDLFWRERKARYLSHVAAHTDPAYHRVSIADKLHNARAILLDYRTHGDALWERFNRKDPAEHLWYYRGLADAFRAAGRAPGTLIGELERVVSELESLVAKAG